MPEFVRVSLRETHSINITFMLCTVLAAVVVMGDEFGVINAIGLAVVISGVVLFNVYKLQKIKKV